MEHQLLNVITLIVVLGVGAQWVAWRLRIPAIVLFSIAGIIAGPVLGAIHPSEDFGAVYKPVISLCVAVILFEGGLNLRIHEFREAASGMKRLVSVGAVLAFVLGSLAAHGIGDLSWPTSLLFGAITVVTGPTVIIPLLRQASLNRRSASYLKWEGIINDPIGALGAVLIFEFFVYAGAGDPMDAVLLGIGKAILASLVIGVGGAFALGRAFQRSMVPEYLMAPVTLGSVLLVFTLTDAIQKEAGLLSVTVMGMVLGNMQLPSLDEMRRFKEYITMLLVSSVFVMLTADLDPNVLNLLDWKTVALVVSMLVVVRPLAIFLTTLFTDMDWRDRVLVGWIAPRGIVAAAVAGVFGPQMVDAGYADAEVLVPVIFALVMVTVTVHGFTIGILSKRLGLSAKPNGVLLVGASPWTTALAEALTKQLSLSVTLVDSSWHRLRDARLAGVNVLYGEILSEELQQSMELNGVSCMLAATSNDAYNALVCRNFIGHLDHDRVFQLPMYAADEGGKAKHKAVARPFTGVMAFADNAQYEELWRKHFQGWKFYKTKITEAYTYDDFLEDCPEDIIPIGVLREGGRLAFHSPKEAQKPKPGEQVFYYAPKKPAASEARSQERKARDVEADKPGPSKGEDGSSALPA